MALYGFPSGKANHNRVCASPDLFFQGFLFYREMKLRVLYYFSELHFRSYFVEMDCLFRNLRPGFLRLFFGHRRFFCHEKIQKNSNERKL
jgi:hypothetical protein